ncbi:hypothetical protein ACLB2K_041240 [Fragaria x ananassa]
MADAVTSRRAASLTITENDQTTFGPVCATTYSAKHFAISYLLSVTTNRKIYSRAFMVRWWCYCRCWFWSFGHYNPGGKLPITCSGESRMKISHGLNVTQKKKLTAEQRSRLRQPSRWRRGAAQQAERRSSAAGGRRAGDWRSESETLSYQSYGYWLEGLRDLHTRHSTQV